VTDLVSFDSLKEYVGFNDASAAALRELHPLARAWFPEIVDDFYDTIAAHPDARAVITGGEAQIARLKATLTAWLDSLLLGPYDDAYLEARARIGRVHVRIGLPQAYMFTAVNRIRVRLGEAVRRSMHDRPAALAGSEHALNQILDLELAIMLETYRQDLTSQSEQAERLAVLGEFASGIGHEMRGPIAVIESSLYLLRQHIGPAAAAAPRVAKHLDRIADQLRRSRRTIDDLLELARNRPVELRRAPVRAAVEAALESAALPSTITVDIAVAPALTADFDWDQMQHALIALFNNANQAMNGVGYLAVQADVDDKGLALRVCDDGPGVPVALHGRIFDALFTTKAKGSGLGLALCRRIVDAHRGRIEIEPSDRGARFALWIPTVSPPAAYVSNEAP
jgi:two-component system, NtrC family, sensor histidine kinase HydH